MGVQEHFWHPRVKRLPVPVTQRVSGAVSTQVCAEILTEPVQDFHSVAVDSLCCKSYGGLLYQKMFCMPPANRNET